MNQQIPVNLSGVVDLGALAAANEIKQAHAQQDSAAAGSNIVSGSAVREITTQNLQETLLQSAQVPFVLVFHATQSENSAKLVAVFTDLVKQFQGRFGLATVSTDTQTQVAQAFGVTAVPAAIAVLQGQPIPLFQGLPQVAEITQTIEKLLAAAAQYGITGILSGGVERADAAAQVPPLPKHHQDGLDALDTGDLAGAYAAYSAALKENPADAEAQAALSQVELLQRIEELNPVRDPKVTKQILETAAAAELTDISAHLAAADLEMMHQREEAAFARLIDVIAATEGENRNLVRERLLALFATLEPGNELVKQARRALANVLF
ncbi:co-chaperone YbbN [Arcanobacterium hippocoleae]|uniref:co-chaperone YbbN n=1 Tax=Arcanobacterium hippocoleae TaxID=149017 RepID=UPI00334055B7